VGFSAFRDQNAEALRRRKARKKSNGNIADDSDDDDDDDSESMGRMDDIDDKDDGNSKPVLEDPQLQGELTEGVNRIHVSPQNSSSQYASTNTLCS
jgi:hypothetical protein